MPVQKHMNSIVAGFGLYEEKPSFQFFFFVEKFDKLIAFSF